MISLEHLARVRPDSRQLAWQELGFYGFVHFGVNTMTGREWGDGSEDPACFDPAAVDTDQWARVFAEAGMRGVIITAKHHDGFCLWPSAFSTHTVAASPWRGGNGDLVAELAASCRRFGLTLGIYLSPWDRADPRYGSGTAYDDVFVGQLTELLTGYGDVFEVWFDGANGEGPNGKKQFYDWERYYRTVRALQPEAVIAVCGPDVRWCGNEAGHTRADEWSVVPFTLRDAERTAERSQQDDDSSFARLVRSDEEDLGSREALAASGVSAGDLVWYPAEVNTSIRPGWFHRSSEDARVRGADELFEIYQASVGGNATFLLNVPPDRDGRIGAPDQESLLGLGDRIRGLRASAVTQDVDLWFSSGEADAPLVGFADGHWTPQPHDVVPWIEVKLPAPTLVDGVVLREQVRFGQRVEQVVVEVPDGTGWRTVAEARSVGYQRILRFAPVVVERARIRVVECRLRPHLAGVGLLSAGQDR